MKLPNIFVLNKGLEEKTGQLLECYKSKPLEPVISELEELLGEMDNSPKYYRSECFHSKVQKLALNKGYAHMTGAFSKDNIYLIKIFPNEEVNVFMRTNEDKRKRYYFATVERAKTYHFLWMFDRDKTKKVSPYPFTKLNGYILGSGLSAYMAFQFLPYLGLLQGSGENALVSVVIGLLGGGLSKFLLKKHARKKHCEKMKEFYKVLITDEKEAIRKAIS